MVQKRLMLFSGKKSLALVYCSVVQSLPHRQGPQSSGMLSATPGHNQRPFGAPAPPEVRLFQKSNTIPHLEVEGMAEAQKTNSCQ